MVAVTFLIVQLFCVCFSGDDNDETGADQKMVLFNEAIKTKGYLVNKDNDYEMDEVEQEERMEAAPRLQGASLQRPRRPSWSARRPRQIVRQNRHPS